MRTNETRVDKTERLLLLSDSFTHPTHGLGLLRAANPDQLDDDATIIVLAPSGMIGPSD